MTGLSSYTQSASSRCHPLSKKPYKTYDLAALTYEFFSSASDLGTALVDETLALMTQTEPGHTLLKAMKRKSICSTPIYQSPDPCRGEIERKVYRGEQIRIPIKFKNISKKSRIFEFAAPHPFKNAKGDTAELLSLSATHLSLDAAETGSLVLMLDVSESFQAGFDYAAKIDVTSEGCDPQYLIVILRVLSDDLAPLVPLDCPCCPPVCRTHWSEHFYCDTPNKV
ncbi:MAG: hypothetical protein IGS38_18590 [Synechococcales cyanobacterium M58_A2018_015]|nr:hypothetical protein [Synechococcales cyanobacterium M58_A2018_015]